MSRYIDADKLAQAFATERNLIDEKCKGDELKYLFRKYACNFALFMISVADKEDVAPVVRCKDCVYGEIDNPDFPNQYLCHYYGDIWNDGVHFCSNGEIRNDR